MIHSLRVQYTDRPPMKPADADYGITINFQRGTSDPVKVFDAMASMLAAFKNLDRLLIGAVDPHLRPITVLEDVEAASITSWIKNKIEAIDDQALKEFDLKQQIGKYAVKAKYRVIKYLDKVGEKQERERLNQLREDLYKLAAETNVRALPLPDHIPLEKLVGPLDEIQSAKRMLTQGETVTFRSENGERGMNLGSIKKPSEILIDPPFRKSEGLMEMVLLVRKPDYLGNSLWEFRHGPTPITAHMLDYEWLEDFRSGRVVIIPGSALSCTVNYEYVYDPTGNIASTHHDIINVHELIDPPPNASDLFDDH